MKKDCGREWQFPGKSKLNHRKYVRGKKWKETKKDDRKYAEKRCEVRYSLCYVRLS